MTSGSCMVDDLGKLLQTDARLLLSPTQKQASDCAEITQHTADIWPQLTADPNSPLVVRKSALKL